MRFKKQKVSKLLACVCLLASLSLLLCGCLSSTSGIVRANINEEGELVLTYSDGREQNLGRVEGETGAAGANGQTGLNGKDGKDGKDGENGVDGAKGEAGEDGKDGSLRIENASNVAALAAATGARSAVSLFCTQTASGGSLSTSMSAGAGILYQLNQTTGAATIITNYHVIYDEYNLDHSQICDQIQVYLYGSEALDDQCVLAEYVGGSMSYDIAVLKVDANDLLKGGFALEATLGDSDSVPVGSTAIAIGNPNGGGTSVTSGVVSVDSEQIPMTMVNGSSTTMRLMRIDTAVNHGNSGGGLFDLGGNVIGIVNAKIVEEDVENIGYAIPINVAKSIADSILYYAQSGYTLARQATFYLELAVTDSKAVYESETGFTHIEETVAVDTISYYSPLYNKLKVNDVLLSVTHNGTPVTITRLHHWNDLMLDFRQGDTLTIKVLRNGSETSVTVQATDLNSIS